MRLFNIILYHTVSSYRHGETSWPSRFGQVAGICVRRSWPIWAGALVRLGSWRFFPLRILRFSYWPNTMTITDRLTLIFFFQTDIVILMIINADAAMYIPAHSHGILGFFTLRPRPLPLQWILFARPDSVPLRTVRSRWSWSSPCRTTMSSWHGDLGRSGRSLRWSRYDFRIEGLETVS